MQAKQIEIMSPVGSFEALLAAIQGGAGSVYFGVGRLNMRSRSTQNFTIEDLETITRICRQNNVRSYLTLNTVVYGGELDEMRNVANAAKKHGVSAVIASDPAVLSYLKSIGMEIHISTQCNISNIDAVRFYAHFADVMVTARELTLDQVAEITTIIQNEQIKGPSGNLVEIEIFVHGALCMAVSGKCYLSLDNMNSSANRGACLQQCRRPYIVKDKESGTELEIDNEYIMSPKDLCTIGIIDKILDAGVSILKIEGRGRSPEYVKKVTQVYHQAVEAVQNGTFNEEKVASWMDELRTVYNRGFWEGYYLGAKFGEWSGVYGSQATEQKIYVGRITNYFPKIKVAEAKLETHSVQPGELFSINGPTTGVVDGTFVELRLNIDPVEKVEKGQVFSFQVEQPVRRADKLYKIVRNKV